MKIDIEKILKQENENLCLTEDQRLALINENNKIFFPCDGFNFLTDHKSLRPGKKHLLLGTTGSGKSTIATSVCFKLAEKTKVYWYASEESLADMQLKISKNRIDNKCLENIEFREEGGFVSKSGGCYKKFLKIFMKDIIESECDIVFFDNLTTSSFYNGQDFKDQELFFNGLSLMIEKIKKSIFIVAHTDNKTKDLQAELFDANSIRGGKTPANKCEYAYAFQSIKWVEKTTSDDGTYLDCSDKEKRASFIRILKSRNHPVSGNIYLLNYEQELDAYLSDKKIDFGTFKKFYDLRVKLK